jgi:tetratricopeptide (TPR) repeat protein
LSKVVAQQAGAPPPASMLLAGIVPPLADSFYQRPETGLVLRNGLYPGDTVVLTQAKPTAAAPAGHGGTGKTQLAVSYAYSLWSVRAVEVLIWVTAASRGAIITGFAEAAQVVGAGRGDDGAGRGHDGAGRGHHGGLDLGVEGAARRFAGWMARTRRLWALILDDLTDPADLENLWPIGPAGQVVITTRLSGDGLDALVAAAARNGLRVGGVGGEGGAAQLRIAAVGGFSPRETLSYLSARLTDRPDQRVEALELSEDLDGLPLGLAQAGAVMKLSGLGCRDYRAQFAERREHMSGVRVAGVSPAVLATWSLAAECAHRLAPAGLAWPALALAALFDTHGIPAAVLVSPAACSYITGRPSAAGVADTELVRATITNLARAGLVSLDPASPIRTVRMHRCVQAAVRAYLPAAELDTAVVAAADALIQAWPDPANGGEQGPLIQALRDCAGALRGVDDGTLWRGEAHPVLFRVGLSWQDSGLTEAAIGYWQTMLITSSRRLGSGHTDSVRARDRLAAAYESGGRYGDAIATFASALAERERHQGYEHPDTITARGQLAHAYASAGRPAEAATLYEHMITIAGRQLGPGHPVTLTARAELAQAYLAAGRGADSTGANQMLLTDAERLLGPNHPMTMSIRENLDHGPAHL